MAAQQIMRLDRAQFAAEFLRRNPDYIEDYRNTQNQIASGSQPHESGLEGLARRWGLSFPACARCRCMGLARRLATGADTVCGCRCHRT